MRDQAAACAERCALRSAASRTDTDCAICADCRKESGSVFVAYAHWRREDAEMTGEIRTYKGRSFCPTCGSRLFNLHDDDIEIRIGALDEAPTSLGPPGQECWIKRREKWLRPIASADQSFEDPPRRD